MITKVTYIERRGASLRAMDVEIARLMDYTDKTTENVAVKFYEAIDGLKTTRDKAAKRLRELHAVSDKAWGWEDAMTGMEDAWTELRNAVLVAISTTYLEVSKEPSGPQAIEGPLQPYRARRIAPRRLHN